MKTRLALALLLLLFLVGVGLVSAGPFLVLDDELQRADLCHVLGGNVKRVIYGAELYARGLCTKLVFIGGKEGEERSFASREKAFAIDQGVPAADIVIDETDVFSTFEEITRLAAVIRTTSPPASTGAPTLTVTYVTDAFHTRRVHMVSRWILDDSVRVQMAPVPFADSYFERSWWKDRRSRKTVFWEYVKLAFYWLRYRLPFQPVNDWLAGFDKIDDR